MYYGCPLQSISCLGVNPVKHEKPFSIAYTMQCLYTLLDEWFHIFLLTVSLYGQTSKVLLEVCSKSSVSIISSFVFYGLGYKINNKTVLKFY